MATGTGSQMAFDAGFGVEWEEARVTAPKHSRFVSVVAWSGILSGFVLLLPTIKFILELVVAGKYRYSIMLIPKSGVLQSLSLGLWALLSLGVALGCWFGGRRLRERTEKGRKMMSAMVGVAILLGLFAVPGWYREFIGFFASSEGVFWSALWLGIKVGLWGLSIVALIKLQTKSVVRECNYVFREQP